MMVRPRAIPGPGALFHTADAFVRGDRITCTVTVADPFGDGESLTSEEKVIANSAPSVGAVTLAPRRIRPNDEVVCSYENFSDLDEDD